jgi:hypothetical protein
MPVASRAMAGARALVLTLLACACGGGDDGDDAVTIDATVIDAPAPDAADRCSSLCECAVSLCVDFYPTQFADMATCMEDCSTLPEATKICRVEHCGYASAPGGAPVHCPHVAGDPDADAPMCLAP